MQEVWDQLAATYMKSKSTYEEEAVQHPGVRLVEHTVL
jgi:hypothetical protein